MSSDPQHLGDVSDGYHTFNELYEHRHALLLALMNSHPRGLMGTNYYLRPNSCADACKHCGLTQEIHIGKSSAGWQFLHRAYVDDQWRLPAIVEWIGCEIRDRKAWLVLTELGEIWDEYGQRIDRQELLARIEAARSGVASTQHGEWFDGPYWFCSGEFS